MIITVSEVPPNSQVVITSEGRSAVVTDRDRATVTPEPSGNAVRVSERRTALNAMLVVLESWVEGTKSNHEALDHRGEMEPCWQQFAPEDIRRMVNDACIEVGINPFADPQ